MILKCSCKLVIQVIIDLLLCTKCTPNISEGFRVILYSVLNDCITSSHVPRIFHTERGNDPGNEAQVSEGYNKFLGIRTDPFIEQPGG